MILKVRFVLFFDQFHGGILLEPYFEVFGKSERGQRRWTVRTVRAFVDQTNTDASRTQG